MPTPTACTPDLVERLVTKVRAGTPAPLAFESEGVDRKRAWRWLRNGQERPGSVYGHLREKLAIAKAEADVVDILIINRAKTQGTTRRTTVTKHEARRVGEDVVMVATEQTVTETQIPPDANLALKMLERRNPQFRPTHQVDTTLNVVPHDVMARTIAEKLRLIQGGTGPSMLQEGDDDARRIMEG